MIVQHLKTTLASNIIRRGTAMAGGNPQTQKPLLTQEQLKKKLTVSNFDPNAILRGAQLTVVGGQYNEDWLQLHLLIL